MREPRKHLLALTANEIEALILAASVSMEMEDPTAWQHCGTSIAKARACCNRALEKLRQAIEHIRSPTDAGN